MAVAEVAHDFIKLSNGTFRCSRCNHSSLSSCDGSSCVVDVPKEHAWLKVGGTTARVCRSCGITWWGGALGGECADRLQSPVEYGWPKAEPVEGEEPTSAQRMEVPHDWIVGTPIGHATCRNCGVVTGMERDARGPGPSNKEPCHGRQPHVWGGSIGKTVLCLRCGTSADVIHRNPLQVTTDASIWCGGKTAQEEWGDFVKDGEKRAREIQAVLDQRHDPVDHPSHYTSSPARCSKCSHPIECIDVVEHMPFNLGNAAKYIWRHGLKGAALEDLKKARWYLDREIANMEKQGKL